MNRVALSAVLSLAAAAPCLAQDLAPDAPLVAEVRQEMDLFHRGDPVAGARVVFLRSLDEPLDEARARATPTGPDGTATIPVPRGGGHLLLWAADRAPAVYRVDSGGRRTFELEDAVELRGRVTDPGGNGVAAQVEVEAVIPVLGGGGVHQIPVTEVRETGADGRFVVGGLCREPVAVRAFADGFVDVVRFPVHPWHGEALLTLGAGARVTGRIRLLPDAAPARGVLVRLGPVETETDEEGRYELRAVPPGPWGLVVEGDGFVRPTPRTVVVEEGVPRHDVDLEVLRTATLTGIVRRPDDAGLDGVTVILDWPPRDGGLSPHEEFPLTVRPDGAFRLTDLVPGDGITLTARCEGAVPLTVSGLSLVPGAESAPVVLDFEIGGALHGRVVDPTAEPVPGAIVSAWAFLADRRVDLSTTQTDDQGRFILSGVPGSEIHLLVVPPAGHPSRHGEFGPLRGVVEQDVDAGTLTLAAGEVLRGRVEGAPAGAVVNAWDASGPAGVAQVTDGLFELGGLVPGELQLFAQLGDDVGAAVAVDVPHPGPVAMTWHAAAVLPVRVTDERDHPVVEGDLLANPVEDPSRPAAHGAIPPEPVGARLRDAAGRVSLALAPGRWRLSLVSEQGHFGAADVVVPPGAEDLPELHILASRGESVRGHVFSAFTGEALEGAVVRVSPVAADLQAPTPSAIAGPSGGFEVHGVPAGILRIRVEADRHAPYESLPMTVEPFSAPVVGRIELEAGVRVHGTVVLPGGVTAAGAGIEFEDPTGRILRAQTDLFGRYEMAAVAPGPTWVRISHPQGDSVLQIHVPRREEAEIHLDLGEGTVLHGTITHRGRGVAGARVVAFTDPGPRGISREAATRADAFGRYRLPPLPAGGVGVEIRVPGAAVPWTTYLDVPEGFDELVDIALPEGRAGGFVVNADDGSAVQGAFVRLYRGGEAGEQGMVVAQAVTGPSGDFEIEHLDAGEYDAVVTRDGFGLVARTRVALVEGQDLWGLRFELPLPASVTVRVVDGGRRAVAGAWVEARRQDADVGAVRVRALAGVEGFATVPGLSEGYWDLRAGAPGLGTRWIGTLRLDFGDLDLGEVHLEPGSALQVTVLRMGLFPAPGQTVTVEDASGRDPRLPADRSTRPGTNDGLHVTGHDGRVLVPDLAPGRYRVRLAGAPDQVVTVRVAYGSIASTFLFAPGR